MKINLGDLLVLLLFLVQIIDLKRDPHGTLDKRGKPTIKTFGNVPKNKTPLQTMEDKLRIANKVNKKYKELMNELDENIKVATDEIGNEAAEALLIENQRSAKNQPQFLQPPTEKCECSTYYSSIFNLSFPKPKRPFFTSHC